MSEEKYSQGDYTNNSRQTNSRCFNLQIDSSNTNQKKKSAKFSSTLPTLKKKNLANFGYLKEFRIQPEELNNYKIGEGTDTSKILILNENVDVTGMSIGKGFQGMVKLYQKRRGPRSHGSKSYRQPGSIGAHTFPGRVLPGKKMPSRMGNEKVTVRNLEVVEFDKEKNVLLVRGAVPGVENSLVSIRPSIKKWNS